MVKCRAGNLADLSNYGITVTDDDQVSLSAAWQQDETQTDTESDYIMFTYTPTSETSSEADQLVIATAILKESVAS